ncbi:vWA domain-containing protein [Halovivax cerinus]|uniref:VWA domain-containing protein n=1 Tax=Halovivax cerinus TaxID=1487865 RepID=A0ABD5NP21_9EURY|nr:VWA domain-containing protein [Halovivax cerinus]
MVRLARERGPMALTLVVVVVLAGCSYGGLQSDAGGNDLGYAVGGAQDADAFRENVESGYLPTTTDITHEGLYYDYYFETGDHECDESFCPAYSRAVTADPLSNETEPYLSVGLNSNLNASDFERERLNLVVVLDTSGSMSSPMAEYYYDGPRTADNETAAEDRKTKPKMDAATDAVVALTDQLEADDRFGLVTFDSGADTVVPLDRMGDRDRTALADDVQSIRAGGGTDLEAGMDRARGLAEGHVGEEGYDTRVVYLTDAMPNIGETSADGLESRLDADADRGIHSTFVGVGLDFNSELVDAITAVRGANYYSVHAAERFEERMGEEFAYMVTPMVYDLELTLDAPGYEIESVYGSPDADDATGELMSVNTLFPSPTEDGASRGGVILLQLNRTGDESTLELTASYEDRSGERHETTEHLRFDDRQPEYFETDSVRKAVLLTRYATLTQHWIEYERATLAGDDPDPPDAGIDESETVALGEWERQSTDLRLSPAYVERFATFRSYFSAEADAIGDDALDQELETMATILETSADGETAVGTNESATTVSPPTD